MSIPWVHHPWTRELRIVIDMMRPMGTSYPSKRGGRTMTSMVMWTMPCTTATLTLLSATTWSGRLGVWAPCPHVSPLSWEFRRGIMGRDTFHFLLLVHPFCWANWKIIQEKNRRTNMWVRKVSPCCSWSLRCSCILVLCTKLSANVQAFNLKWASTQKATCVQTWADNTISPRAFLWEKQLFPPDRAHKGEERKLKVWRCYGLRVQRWHDCHLMCVCKIG